jgi:hypothetical protein
MWYYSSVPLETPYMLRGTLGPLLDFRLFDNILRLCVLAAFNVNTSSQNTSSLVYIHQNQLRIRTEDAARPALMGEHHLASQLFSVYHRF